MSKDIKLEKLKELGIYELRELARMLNVPSPTTKKRKELESDILLFSQEQKLDLNSQIKKGRPPKSIKKVDDLLDVFIPKEFAEVIINKRTDNELSDYLKMCQSERYDEIRLMEGYLRKTLSNEYYIRSNIDLDKVASVPHKLVEWYDLVEGDKINGKASKSDEDKFYLISEIFDVNDKAPNPDRNLVENNEFVLPYKNIKGFEGYEEGGRVLFVCDTFREGIDKIKDVCEKIKDEYKFIILAPNVTTYNKLLIESKLKGDFMFTTIEDHPAYLYDVVTNCINYANVLLAEKQKVIVVVLDLFGVKNGIENHLAMSTNQISFHEDLESARIVLRLLNMAKAVDDESSISVFSFCMTHEQDTAFFKNHIKKNTDSTVGC